MLLTITVYLEHRCRKKNMKHPKVAILKNNLQEEKHVQEKMILLTSPSSLLGNGGDIVY